LPQDAAHGVYIDAELARLHPIQGPGLTPQQFIQWLADKNRRPLVMGVLNVTPDSFSDGGRFQGKHAAIDHAMEMIADGADLIDIGGESTRPGSSPVPAQEQIRRIAPVIGEVVKRTAVTLSVDTTRSDVASAALDVGAVLVNDISAGRDDPGMFAMVAQRSVPIVLMHMQGTPATMQVDPQYGDVVNEVKDSLAQRMRHAQAAGVDANNILLDPGIGFGKTASHNLNLIRQLRQFQSLGRPIVVGVSRKGFIGRITGEPEPRRRVFGSAAAVAWSVANGTAIVRVHDVKAMSQVVRMIEAIQQSASGDFFPTQ
jgi:dihydropteroate synthase